MRTKRRTFLVGAAAVATDAALARSASAETRIFRPEQFGARGNGVANDTLAFAALASAVNAAGGGIVEFRKTTYLVGAQIPHPEPGAHFSWAPVKLLQFNGCSKPLILRGNGARIRCADGLRYGTFAATGERVEHHMPYVGPGVATPYWAMIWMTGCIGPIQISDLELDGNLPGHIIGGPYGDTGYQVAGTGILLTDNRSDEIITNVHTHHHGQDGLMIQGIDAVLNPMPRRLISGLSSEYNGRQGCSITGGRGYAFEKCRFAHMGRSTIHSAPGAGVDIEAEGPRKNRDHRFTDCEFIDNEGCGMVADSGDSDGALFTRCTFIGTTSWSAWPNKPHFRFQNCRFVGSLVKAYGDKDPERAAQFYDCVWRDDPRLSPNGKVYLGGKKNYQIADLSGGLNVRFVRCTFNLTHDGLLPWSWYAIYQDCRMSQAAPVAAYPKGKYLGTSVINAKVDLYGTHVIGTVIENGKTIRNMQLGGKSW